MIVMIAHGFNTGALFLLIGVIYQRAHTRQISAFGGLARSMPIYAAFWVFFMFASVGLPGLSGFIGEFLVALAVWDYNKVVAIFTFSIVIVSAWYMLWMVQRILFGRAKGEAPDPGDTELTPEEKLEVAAMSSHGHGHEPIPAVSGGSHDHHEESEDGIVSYPDLNRVELLCLVPLAVLSLLVGVYPRIVIEFVQPSFERILAPFLS